MLLDVLRFKRYATYMQHEYQCMYRTFFSKELLESVLFLRVSTSGALAVEYWMGVLALTDIYSADNIAR